MLILDRITSTYVEKIFHLKTYQFHFQDHLHIRGENIISIFSSQFLIGSPPHTWRKSTTKATHKHYFRITSTYVEKIISSIFNTSLVQDHLHIRGENTESLNVLGGKLGITSTYVEKIDKTWYFYNGS